MRRALFLGLVLIVALGACGGGEKRNESKIQDPFELIVPTLQPRTIIEGCTDIDIENWADLMLPNLQEFMDESQAYVTQVEKASSDELRDTWNRLVALRDNMTTYPTPTCLERQHDQVLNRLQSILEEYQKFGIGRSSVSDFQEGFNADMKGLEEQIDRLNIVMNELYTTN
ncbi:MAG: hypothetical protein CUN55_05145 [Phototrophicales bacterium]|nr:MAG: hypothetical protein CUN55_05145 [Phototrophicales bacterium]